MPSRSGDRKVLVVAIPCAVFGDLQDAFAALGHVSGEIAAQDVVSGVFARFCIGK